MTVNNKAVISSYIEKYKNENPYSKLSPKKMMAINAFVEAKEICSFLPDNEQTKMCKRYVKRLYKWFDVIITKEQIIAMSKLSITNGDMHRNYLKYVKGGEEA